jgi:hypothetical protein
VIILAHNINLNLIEVSSIEPSEGKFREMFSIDLTALIINSQFNRSNYIAI